MQILHNRNQRDCVEEQNKYLILVCYEENMIQRAEI